MLLSSPALALEKIKYPVLCNTYQQKVTFCYEAKEKLRLEHNAKGKDYRDGKITEKAWKEYLDNEFLPKQDLIINDILIHKESMKKSTDYTVDLNDLEKTLTP